LGDQRLGFSNRNHIQGNVFVSSHELLKNLTFLDIFEESRLVDEVLLVDRLRPVPLRKVTDQGRMVYVLAAG